MQTSWRIILLHKCCISSVYLAINVKNVKVVNTLNTSNSCKIPSVGVTNHYGVFRLINFKHINLSNLSSCKCTFCKILITLHRKHSYPHAHAHTWTHHKAHPLALSQHVILMMQCGMPHYRHTTVLLLNYWWARGFLHFSRSTRRNAKAQGMSIPHSATKHTFSKKKQYWLHCQVYQSSSWRIQQTCTQWGLIGNGKWIFCDNLFCRNEIQNNYQ